MHHKTQKLEFSRYTGWPKEKVVQGWPWGGEGQRSCTHLTILQANQESLAAWGVIGRDTYLPVLQADQEPLSTSGSADDLYVPNQGLHQPLFLFNSLEGEALKSFVLLDWKKTTHLINAICPITCLKYSWTSVSRTSISRILWICWSELEVSFLTYLHLNISNPWISWNFFLAP